MLGVCEAEYHAGQGADGGGEELACLETEKLVIGCMFDGTTGLTTDSLGIATNCDYEKELYLDWLLFIDLFQHSLPTSTPRKVLAAT